MISIRWSKVQHINPPQDHLFYKTIEYTRSNSFYFLTHMRMIQYILTVSTDLWKLSSTSSILSQTNKLCRVQHDVYDRTTRYGVLHMGGRIPKLSMCHAHCSNTRTCTRKLPIGLLDKTIQTKHIETFY